MGKTGIKIVGTDKVIANLLKLPNLHKEVAMKTLLEVADKKTIPLAKERSPFLTGDLESTIRRHGPIEEQRRGVMIAELRAGGVKGLRAGQTVSYAADVHEEAQKKRKSGERKFLQTAWIEGGNLLIPTFRKWWKILLDGRTL